VTEILITTPAYEDEAQRSARLAREVPELLAAQGVSAAYTDFAPFQAGLAMLGAGAAEPRRTLTAGVSADYFQTLGHTVFAGRVFAEGPAGANEIVVNAMLAERLGGVAAALGASVMVDSQPRTIVGVIRDARDVGNMREVVPAIYRPLRHSRAPRLLTRARDAEVQRVVTALRASDPALGVSARPYAWYIANSASGSAGAAAMAGALGLLALLLASIGIFGVFAFWVRQRRREIGVRIALGATRGRILRMVLGATGRAVGWGIALGLAASAGVAMILRSQLYGLSPFDPLTFVAALGVLLASAALATALPAWRAVRVNPAETLRVE
jgi:putative ABC transport system permease protein